MSLKILALCGSLRKHSTNKLLLEACAQLAPAGVEICLYSGMGALPLFNPDIEDPDVEMNAAVSLDTVEELRAQMAAADGLLIASPEYTHGITSAIKNAIDWLISSGELSDKPTAILNASPRSNTAYLALLEIMQTADACLCENACIDVPILGNFNSAIALAQDPDLSLNIKHMLNDFSAFINKPSLRAVI